MTGCSSPTTTTTTTARRSSGGGTTSRPEGRNATTARRRRSSTRQQRRPRSRGAGTRTDADPRRQTGHYRGICGVGGNSSSRSNRRWPAAAAAAAAPSPKRLLLLAAAFALATAAAVGAKLSDDWFQLLDSNHDGAVDKSEFEDGLSKLQAFVMQPLAANKDGASGGGAGLLSLLFGSFGSSSVFNLVGFWKAFTSAVAMIIATEIGDKTFFIAAVLSMKHPRSAVFGGAILALVAMTVLSTAMGLVLPNILPKEYTHLLSGVLFLYFGFKLISESRAMESGKTSDELEEVEEELLSQNNKKNVDAVSSRHGDDDDVEAGTASKNSSSSSSNAMKKKHWYHVTAQAFTLTFLAEWGDRSQIATIALAAAKNPVGVTVGGCLGHSICTGIACVGGRMLAARIEEKTVHLYVKTANIFH